MGTPNSKSSKKIPEMNVSELDIIFAKNSIQIFKNKTSYIFSTKVKKIDFFLDFPYMLGGGPLKYNNRVN